MKYPCFHETVTKTKFMGKKVDLLIRAFNMPEETDPSDDLEPEDAEKIRNGTYGWCCIKVEATLLHKGKTLGSGTDYLGCVSYVDESCLKGTMISHDMPEVALERAIKDATDKYELFSQFKRGA